MKTLRKMVGGKKFRGIWLGASLTLFLLTAIALPSVAQAQAVSEGWGSILYKPIDWTVGLGLYGVTLAFLNLSILLITGCSYLLDMAIRVSLGIDGMNILGSTSPFLSAGVQTGWEVLRDIANMGFIFALIYIAIRTMLNIGGSSLQKQVIAVIIGALMINFSAFFALVVIDAGNGLATVAYNQITRMEGPADANTLKDAFGQFLRPQALLQDTIANLNWTQTAIVFFLATILYLYAAYILIEAAFMFIIRTIYLMFSIVMAPLAFIAYAIPGLQGYLRTWFDDLARQSMIAPAYIIMLLFLFLFASKLGATNRISTDSLGNLVSGNMGATGAIFIYIFMLFLMKTCLKFARSVSKEVSGAATSLAGSTVGLLAGGAGGFAARNLLGRGASMLAKSGKFKDYAEKPKGFVGNLGRNFVVNRVKGVAGGSFDFRNSAAGKAASEQLSAKFGTAKGSGGFTAQEEASKKKDKERKEAEKKYKTRQEVDKAVGTLAESLTGLVDAATQERFDLAQRDARNKLETTIPGLSIKDLEGLGAKKLKDKNVVASLTPSQIENIMKSENFSDADKAEIAEARRTPLKLALDNLSETPRDGEAPRDVENRIAAAKKVIRAFSEKELDGLPAKDFLDNPEFAQNVTQSQFDSLIKSYNLSAFQKQNLKKSRTKSIEEAFAKDPNLVLPPTPEQAAVMNAAMNKATKTISGMNTKTIAELDIDLLTDPDFMRRMYKVNFLQKLATTEGMTQEKIDRIRDAVINSPDPTLTAVKTWMQDETKGGIHFS